MRGLSWTSANEALCPTQSRWGAGGDATDCAGVEFGAIRAGGFLPVRPVEGTKPRQVRTFAAAELASSMTLKS